MRLAILVVLVALTTSASAQFLRDLPERNSRGVLPEPDPRGAEFDEACSKIAFQVIMGMQDPRGPGWIKTCGEHPNINVCRETLGVIKQSGKSIDMTCTGRRAR